MVQATVAAGPGTARDWIGLYRVGFTAQSNLLAWRFLNGTRVAGATGLTAATVSFAGLTPGSYVVKFYRDYTWSELATSGSVTVAGAGVTVTSPSSGVVQAVISGGPGLARDWVGLYRVGATTQSDLLAWRFLNGTFVAGATGTTGGTVSFSGLAPGSYVVKFYRDYTWSEIASSGPASVP